MVINGATGEKYLIRTLEYNLDEFDNSKRAQEKVSV